jgi:transcriptional regulator with XRE-family HTH domain
MKKYRKKACMTQEKLAVTCNTDPKYIGQIEIGHRFPSIGYIEKIAAALHIQPYQLFYDETAEIAEEMTPKSKKRILTQKLIEKVSADIQLIIGDSAGG